MSQAGVQSRTFKESSNRLSSQGTTWQGKIIDLCEKSHRLGIAMRKIPLLLLKIYNIQVVRISPHGKLLATGGDDGHLRVWSFPDLAKVMVMLFLIFPRQGDVKYNIFDSNVM